MTVNFYSIVKAGARTLVTALAFVLTVFSAAAQKQVGGTVKDSDGEPLPGVMVTVPGTGTGTVTSTSGAYSVNVPEGSTQLRFSFIGFEDVTENIGSRTVIDVVMRESAAQLDEVVAVGYGVQRRRDLTGAVSSVNSGVLEAMPVATATEAITGRMAGVQVVTSEGGPDAEIRITVRGGGSITQDNSPLYIVDGFPVTSINDIAPGDIETIDVLKDASSTAVYGARGANGVIIVTTKSGKAGKVTVSLNGYAGIKQLTKTLDVLSPYEYVMWQYERANYSASVIDNDKAFMKYYGAFDDLELYKNRQGTNWQEEVFGRNAITQNYNLSVSGGSEKVRFNIGLTHSDDQSIMIGSGYQRDNITAKLRAELSPKIFIDFNTRWAQTVVNGSGTSTEGGSSTPRMRHTLKYAPTNGIADFVVDDEDYLDQISISSDLVNPVRATNDEYRRIFRRDLAYNGAFNWEVAKGLMFRSELGITQRQGRTDRFYGPSTSLARQQGNTATIDIDEYRSWRISNTLTYVHDMGRCGNLTAMVGQETNSLARKKVEMESYNFSRTMSYKLALANMGLAVPLPTQTNVYPDDNMLSYFGRVNYSLKDRYLFTATLRADGSSKFSPGNRWGYFPAFAAAWRISEESWMASSRGWIDNLKLRVSYGSAGNNRIPDDVWKQLLEVSQPGKPYSINGVEQAMLIPSSELANYNIRWETTITRNVGTDFSFWRGRLTGMLDYYFNSTKDLLIRASIPPNSGYSFQFQNIGETSNRGIELTLDGVLINNRDFRLGAGFNIAFNRGRVEELGPSGTYPLFATHWYNSANPDADYQVTLGQPVGLMYGFVTDGMYSFDDFDYVLDPASGRATWTLKSGVVNSAAITGSPVLPGTLKFKDLDNSGDISLDDRTVIGNAQPKAIGGFNINARWKNFDMAVYANYSIGNDIYNANKLELSSYPLTRAYGNLFDFMKDRFTYIDRQTGESLLNDIDRLKAANADAKYWSPLITRVPLHSWAIEDGSFLRISNVTIGYTIPKRLSRKILMENLRVYFTCYNLAVFTNYSGYDPEVSSRNSSNLSPGVDYSAFPRARTYLGGLNITF